jgi:hypothetical protein
VDRRLAADDVDPEMLLTPAGVAAMMQALAGLRMRPPVDVLERVREKGLVAVFKSVFLFAMLVLSFDPVVFESLRSAPALFPRCTLAVREVCCSMPDVSSPPQPYR